MKTDLLDARQLFQLYPNILRFIRYEELADRPVHVFRKIYEFLRLNWTDGIESETKAQTGSFNKTVLRNSSGAKPPRKKVRANHYSLTRTDSSAAANHWRASIPFRISQTVEQQCAEMMTILGFHKFKTLKTLRDQSLSSRGRFKYVEDLPFLGGNLS